MEKEHQIISTSFNADSDTGLVSGHAYTMLGVTTYNGEKLVKIRNPWGSEMYEGPWGDDDDDKWTDDARATLEHESGDDGTFFMPYQTFLEEAYDIEGCNYKDWKRAYKHATWNDNTTDVDEISHTIHNPVAQEVAFQLGGLQERNFEDYENDWGKNTEVKSDLKTGYLEYEIIDKSTGEEVVDSKNWDWGETRDWLEYTHLPAGDYEFRLRDGKMTNPGNVMPYGVVALGAEQMLEIRD